jgi:hypothetical protein
MGSLQFFPCSASLHQATRSENPLAVPHLAQRNYPIEKNGGMCMLAHLVKLQIGCRVPLRLPHVWAKDFLPIPNKYRRRTGHDE